MTRCDVLESEIAEMESRLFQVKVTMEVEKDKWLRANKLNKKSGTHWRNAKLPSESPPIIEVRDEISNKLAHPKKSLSALFRKSIDKWSTSDVVSWLGHLKHESLVTMADNYEITGLTLLNAHVGLSDINLRQLFRINHPDSHWKDFVRDIAELHREHVKRSNQEDEQVPVVSQEKLPALTPQKKNRRVKGGGKSLASMVTCWGCGKHIQRSECGQAQNGKIFCSTTCQKQQLNVSLGISMCTGNDRPEMLRTKTPITPHKTRKPIRAAQSGTAAFVLPMTRPKTPQTNKNIDVVGLLGHSLITPVVNGNSQVKSPTAPPNARCNKIRPRAPQKELKSLRRQGAQLPPSLVVTNVYHTASTLGSFNKYRMESSPATMTLTSVFVRTSSGSLNGTITARLTPFLRLSAWSRLTIVNSMWYQASQQDDADKQVWRVFFDQLWRNDPIAQAEWDHQGHSWKRALKALNKRVSRLALDNVKRLLAPEAWQLATETLPVVDRLSVVVTVWGEIVAVIQENTQLVFTLVPEVSTIAVLQGLHTGKFYQFQCHRLKLFNPVRIPPLESWSSFPGHKTFCIDGIASQRVFQATVVNATTRKVGSKLRSNNDIYDKLLKRAKEHPEAVAILDAVFI
ncbi:hypothetical protein AC1031_010660 [Aphanomyces cochlioides]|nr:hypothetical protein AC1031_010660 [Aphanomyces cochlioides]